MDRLLGHQQGAGTERAGALPDVPVAEEAGLEVEVGPLIDVVDSITRDGQGAVQYHYTLVDLLAGSESED